MRVFVLVGLLLFVLVSALRHRRAGAHASRLLIAASLIAAGTGFAEAKWQMHQWRYARVASDLLGRDNLGVRCQRWSEALFDDSGTKGVVAMPVDGSLPHVAHLSYDTCKSLASYVIGSKAEPANDETVAVQVFTHEIMHLTGIRDEAAAECAAIQHSASVAALLGAQKEEAMGLSQHYYAAGYPNIDPAYASAECGPGGKLDQGVLTAPW